MISSTSYYSFLFLIIIFYCIVLMSNIKKTPKKLKLIMGILLGCALLKNIAILIISLSNNPMALSLGKLLCYLDLFYVPSMLVIIFYIFWKNNNFNLNIIISAIVLLGVSTVFLIMYLKARFSVFLEYGYIVNIDKNIFIIVYVAILLILLSIILLSKKYARTNHKGILVETIVIICFIIEYLTLLCDINIYPYMLMSELLFIGLISYSIESFKGIN